MEEKLKELEEKARKGNLRQRDVREMGLLLRRELEEIKAQAARLSQALQKI